MHLASSTSLVQRNDCDNFPDTLIIGLALEYSLDGFFFCYKNLHIIAFTIVIKNDWVYHA